MVSRVRIFSIPQNRHHRANHILVFIIIGGIFLVDGVKNVMAAVDLRYFRANALETKITIEWGTATELDHAGFYVTRALTSNGVYQRISPFIYARGDSLTGADYVYDDQNVEAGITYWYKLESIDTSQRSNYSNPVSVGYKLPTSSSTPTRTSTTTPTWPPSPTIRSNVTLNPTITSRPTTTLLPTITQGTNIQPTEAVTEPIYTATDVVDFNATAIGIPSRRTPIPFPTITIQFPTKQVLSTRTPFDGYQPKPQSENEDQVVQISRFLLYFILLGIWVILGYWLYRITRTST